MIIGIGIDAVQIDRFADWHTFGHTQLQRTFSEHEIAYCLSAPLLTAERFAVRLAAREALFKALSPAYPHLNFLKLCRSMSIMQVEGSGAPRIIIAPTLGIDTQKLTIHCSLTHSDSTAIAMVIIEDNSI